jgi:tetratricopeptide (TPR) repeat protein
VLLVTVPVNLRDCPPFGSAAPGHAEREFRTAHDLLTKGRTEEASAHFRRARDFDTLRFRADTRINEIIREVAPREKARLVDAERSFGIAGNDLFWEHLHFTPIGTFRLASLIAAELGARNTPTFEEVRQTLPITRWDERNIRSQIAALLQRPPFTFQAGNAERIAALRVDDDIKTVYAEARPVFEHAVSRRPNDVNLLFRYASLLREAGDSRASSDVFGKMIQLIPARKAWHVSRGAALSDAGLQDAAIVEHNAALAMDADFDLAHFGLGLAKARMGNHEEAIRHYSDALRLNPWYAEAAYNIAGSLAALGRTQEARRELERAVTAKPGFSRAHAALAQLYAGEGRVDDAIGQYRQAVAGEPRIPEAHYDLGLLLARQGRLDEAVAQYEQAIQLRPDFPNALNNLGIALARRGDTSAAAQAFTRAITLQPSFEAARTNLERIRKTAASGRN